MAEEGEEEPQGKRVLSLCWGDIQNIIYAVGLRMDEPRVQANPLMLRGAEDLFARLYPFYTEDPRTTTFTLLAQEKHEEQTIEEKGEEKERDSLSSLPPPSF